ncbi:MAG: MBL fold metallo-hydrolase [Candidatus Hodarchaeota archaeon]
MEYLFEQTNPGNCKSYLCGNDGNNVLIVDPVLEELHNYVDLLEKRRLNLTYILETHTHADHISGAAALKDRTNAEIIMHDNAPAKCVGAVNRVKEGSLLKVAGFDINVLYTPGHTKDSVSYIFPGKILTGDALFLDDGGAGRDDLPGGSPEAHYDTLRKLLDLPGDLVVYPAHDYRNRAPSSLENQKKTNPHLKKSIGPKQEFVDYINNLKLGPAEWMKDVLKANYACSLDPTAAWIPADSSSCEVKGTMDLGANAQEISPITPEELRNMLDLDDPPYLLDVREPFELKIEGKLDGVDNIPITQLTQKLPTLEKYKNKKIVSICKMGGRAYTAGQILKQVGFSDVVFLEGGMLAWKRIYGDAKK